MVNISYNFIYDTKLSSYYALYLVVCQPPGSLFDPASKVQKHSLSRLIASVLPDIEQAAQVLWIA
jgi:hypothetical protein